MEQVVTDPAADVQARAALEGWRPPVSAAAQPVLLLDDRLGVVAASRSARRLLGIGRGCRDLSAAGELTHLAADAEAWAGVPVVRAVRTGAPATGHIDLDGGAGVEVVASPLFGPDGVIGATAFLTAS